MKQATKRITVTGGTGLLGTALQKVLPQAIYLNSKSGDLTDQQSVRNVVSTKPDIIIHCAARVSGIKENIEKPAEHFYDNIMMNTMLMHEAYKAGVKRFICILSTCAYPDDEKLIPYSEDDILKGLPTPTNFAYGMAKRMAYVQADTYNKQYGTKYQCLIPGNLYGIGDKYDDRSHFVGALLTKIHIAKLCSSDKITLLGDGTPLRQFLLADDFARAIKLCIDNDVCDHMNIVPDENRSIREIAVIAADACKCDSDMKIDFDNSPFNGQMNKQASGKRFMERFPDFKFTGLSEGIRETYLHDFNKKPA